MTINKTATAVAWCDLHGKLLYATRKDARRIANKHRGEHKSPYECKEAHPGYWHIGALHPLVIQGQVARDGFKKRRGAA